MANMLTEQTNKDKNQSAAHANDHKPSSHKSGIQFDNSREAIQMRKVQQMINGSSQVRQMNAFQKLANNHSQGELSLLQQQTIKNTTPKDQPLDKSPLQLRTKRFKPKADDPTLNQLEIMSANLDGLTMGAHADTLKALKANKPSQIKDKVQSGSGYYTNWMKNPNPMTTGYVIEDIVTNAIKGHAGYESQVVVGQARPDFVITDGVKRGVVDVTSSKEAGHVLDKNFSLSYYDYVSESLYPSIDFSDIDGASFDFTNEDLELIRESNKVRAKAKMGERLSTLKKNLRLIQDQHFNEPSASRSATSAINSINKVVASGFHPDEVWRADSFIEDVIINLSYKATLDDVASIKDDLMERYDLDDESAFV